MVSTEGGQERPEASEQSGNRPLPRSTAVSFPPLQPRAGCALAIIIPLGKLSQSQQKSLAERGAFKS